MAYSEILSRFQELGKATKKGTRGVHIIGKFWLVIIGHYGTVVVTARDCKFRFSRHTQITTRTQNDACTLTRKLQHVFRMSVQPCPQNTCISPRVKVTGHFGAHIIKNPAEWGLGGGGGGRSRLLLCYDKQFQVVDTTLLTARRNTAELNSEQHLPSSRKNEVGSGFTAERNNIRCYFLSLRGRDMARTA